MEIEQLRANLKAKISYWNRRHGGVNATEWDRRGAVIARREVLLARLALAEAEAEAAEASLTAAVGRGVIDPFIEQTELSVWRMKAQYAKEALEERVTPDDLLKGGDRAGWAG
jgi:hypothetical protein